MKEKNKKAETKQLSVVHISKKSYETDPTLKEIASTLEDKSGTLRNDEIIHSSDYKLAFDESYPTGSDVSLFAREAGDLPELKQEFKDSLDVISKVFSNAFSNHKEYEEMNFHLQKMLIENFFQTARALAISVEARDPYTGGHSDRVFQISTELGKRCNLGPKEQMYLEGGALLHDIGKIGIRDGVLLKAGPFTDSEYKEMQLHPIIGSQIVKRLNCLFGCNDAVLFHHERMDGYGYPYGLKGKDIPFIARIISIADAYDAMATNRVYRKALSHEDVLEEIIRNSGTQFDPEIVKVFAQWWEERIQPKITSKQTA